MINNNLGPKIDIHGGGMDLRFPHHENEAAQQEALHHNALANYWIHNAMVNINGEKMSKSLGNTLWAKDVVEKLTWRQWQDLLDRVGNREDERIFQWLKQLPGKIREDDWREFEKALNLYLKGKDTSVFETDELFAIYDSLMRMCVIWREKFKVFALEHPKSAKIKTKGTWAKKYYARCFNLKKERRTDIVTEEVCNAAFSELIE